MRAEAVQSVIDRLNEKARVLGWLLTQSACAPVRPQLLCAKQATIEAAEMLAEAFAAAHDSPETP